MKILTKKQSRHLDDIAINKMGIPGKTLMGNAGNEVAQLAMEMLSDIAGSKVGIFCGKGNNGGDGYKAGLELHKKAIFLTLFVLPDKDQITGDARLYYDQCAEAGCNIIHTEDPPENENFDLIVDGILGTGSHGELVSPLRELTKWINEQNVPILSIDIPTGVDSDTGLVAAQAIIATKTVTMGYPKLGMVLKPGLTNCGEIICADIGFPDIYDNLKGLHWSLVDDNLIRTKIAPPAVDTYKHKQGKVLVVAGSKGMTGAAVLATMACMRAGAGLAIACAPESLNSIFETNIIEGLTIACQDKGRGYLGLDNLEKIEPLIDWCDSILIGPGLGGQETTKELVYNIVVNTDKSVVIDADALRIIADRSLTLNQLGENIILTPHRGEFESLSGISQDELRSNLSDSIQSFMDNFRGSLILKGAPTICSKGKTAIINSTGNQGLASGGTGDVLAGIVASYVAQGLNEFDASLVAVYLHGKAADELVSKKGYRGQIASDLLQMLPIVTKDYENQ
jgi:NAD(P)H-hydrate epimerase